MRVLVVDRDKAVAETLVMVLNSGGLEAVAAFDGEQALAIAQESAFDVLLTDVMMDPINGIQIALATLKLQPSIRVILFSGSDRAAPVLAEAAQAGHNFLILPKPLHPSELLLHLRNGASPASSTGPSIDRTPAPGSQTSGAAAK